MTIEQLKQAFADHMGYTFFDNIGSSDVRVFNWFTENKKLFYNVAYNEGYEDGFKDAKSERPESEQRNQLST